MKVVTLIRLIMYKHNVIYLFFVSKSCLFNILARPCSGGFNIPDYV